MYGGWWIVFLVDVAKNGILVTLKRTFLEFLDHVLSQINKKVRDPKIDYLMMHFFN
jgi:hypothetical protein